MADFSAWKTRGGGMFRGRGVVVTGGAAGIGRAIAIGFALEGARVTVLDSNVQLGRKAAGLLRCLSPDSRFVKVDLRDPAAIEKVSALFSGPGGADILVNNAAMVGKLAAFHELDGREWGDVLQVNLHVPFLLSQRAAAGMIRAGKKGSIVNILTIQTGAPIPGHSAYVASKGGLDALTLAMAVDLAPYGIRVNGVRVGSVLTENYLAMLPEALKQEVNSRGIQVLHQRAATLMGRMGLPVEIARIALFVASEQASYLTGSIICADGGRAISRKAEPLS